MGDPFNPVTSEGVGTDPSDLSVGSDGPFPQPGTPERPTARGLLPSYAEIRDLVQRFGTTLTGGPATTSPEKIPRLGSARLWCAPDDPDCKEGEPQFQQASSWAIIAALGVIRFLAAVRGHTSTVIFPNLSELDVDLTIAKEGTVQVNNGGRGSFRDRRGTLTQVTVSRVEGHDRRIQIGFPDGDNLLLDFTIHTPGRGEAVSLTRLVLTDAQPPFTGSNSSRFLIPRLPPYDAGIREPSIRQVEKVSSNSVRGRGGANNTYLLTLSNGDVMRVVVFTDHHDSEYRGLSASLNRFGAANHNRWLDLAIDGHERRARGSLRIYGHGYDVRLGITVPSGGSGGDVVFDSLRWKTVPEPVLPVAPPPREVRPWDVADPTKPVWVVPDEKTARMLNDPRWDGQKVELVFVGEIGGRRIDSQSPLVVEGHFRDGTFVPIASGEGTSAVISIPDGKPPLLYRVVRTKDGWAIQIPLLADTLLELAPVSHGKLVGLGAGDKAAEKLAEVYKTVTLRSQPTPKIEEWERGSTSTIGEILQIFSRDALADEPAVAIQQAQGESGTLWIRVRLQEENEILLRRRETTEGPVEFELVSANGELAILRLGGPGKETLEGLTGTRGGHRFFLKPWRVGTPIREDAEVESYRGETMRGVRFQIDSRQGSLKITVPGVQTRNQVSGLLSKVLRNGHEILTFELEDGRTLQVTSTPGVDHEQVITALALPDDDVNQEMKVEILSPDGVVTEGKLTVKPGSGEWRLQVPGRDPQILSVDVDRVDRTGTVAIRLAPPPPVIERITYVAPALPEALVAARGEPVEAPAPPPPPPPQQPAPPAPPTVALPVPPAPEPPVRPTEWQPVTPTLEKRFPWEDQAFALPDHETRMRMRFGGFPDDDPRKPREGARAEFHFLGGLHSEDGETRAREVLNRMRRYERLASEDRYDDARGYRGPLSFFEWVIHVDMVFRDGQWVPDPMGQMEVMRRFPYRQQVDRRDQWTAQDTRGGGQNYRLGFFEMANVGGTFPVTPVAVGSSWGLGIGPGRVIQNFRVPVDDPGKPVYISPDYGLSFGPPSEAAARQLVIVEQKTGAREYEIGAQPPRVSFVQAITADGHVTRVVPEFGSPIYRSSAVVNENISIIDFSPGYSPSLPDDRFTQFRIYDGNGLNFRLVFQHTPQGVHVVGAEAMGRIIRDFTVTQTGEHEFRVSGLFPTRFQLSSGDKTTTELPFEIVYTVRGGDFSILRGNIAVTRFETGGLHFNPAGWNREAIFQERTGTSIEIRVTRMEGKKPGGGRPPGGGAPIPPTAPIILIPSERDRAKLSQRKDRGRTLSDGVYVAYELPTEPGKTSKVEIPFNFDPNQGIYVPAAERGVALVYVDGEATPIEVVETESGRYWRLNFGEGPFSYIGNFFTHETEKGGQPIPILWLSSGRDPRPRLVTKHLVESGLAPEPTKVPFNPKSKPEFEAEVKVGDTLYRIPFRVMAKQGRRGDQMSRLLFIPTGAATKISGKRTQEVPVNYYFPYRGSPALLEIDGHGFELSEHGIGLRLHLRLARQHPGAAGTYTAGRSNTHIRLEPHDQSALVFVEINRDSFLDDHVKKVLGAKGEGDKIVRRVLVDGISGIPHEFLFHVAKDSYGRATLKFRGLAQLTSAGPVPESTLVLTDGGRIYIRLEKSGHYFSLSQYPSDSLVIRCYGKTIDRGLLRKQWVSSHPSPDQFSPTMPKIPGFNLTNTFWDTRSNREGVRDRIAIPNNVVPEIIWDTDHVFPKGMILYQSDGSFKERVFTRPMKNPVFRVEGSFDSGAYTPKSLRIFYRGQEIPHELIRIEGRPFVVLKGPLKGVIFYFSPLSRGRGIFFEVSHPAVREQLERDMGYEPLERPHFLPGADGIRYAYPEETPELVAAIGKQVARNRLWRLEKNGFLPSHPSAQDRIAELLIPEPQNYKPTDRPPLLVTLEEMTDAHEPLRKVIWPTLQGLANGAVTMAEVNELVDKWAAVKGSPQESEARREAMRHLVETLTRLARKAGPARGPGSGSSGGGAPPPVGPIRAAPNDPRRGPGAAREAAAPPVATRAESPAAPPPAPPLPSQPASLSPDVMGSTIIGKEAVKRAVHDAFGSDLSTWIEDDIEKKNVETIDGLVELAKSTLNAGQADAILQRLEAEMGPLTPVHKAMILLEVLNRQLADEKAYAITDAQERMRFFEQVVRESIAGALPAAVLPDMASPSLRRYAIVVAGEAIGVTTDEVELVCMPEPIPPLPRSFDGLMEELGFPKEVLARTDVDRLGLKIRLRMAAVEAKYPARYDALALEIEILERFLTTHGHELTFNLERMLRTFIDNYLGKNGSALERQSASIVILDMARRQIEEREKRGKLMDAARRITDEVRRQDRERREKRGRVDRHGK